LNWLKKCIGLNGENNTKLDFYADSDAAVLLSRMKICFVRKIDGFYHKKIENKAR